MSGEAPCPWPVPYGVRKRFQATQEDYVFRPMEVKNRLGISIPPKTWADILPGALVEVAFSLHHAASPKTKCDDFGAWPKTTRVIRCGLDHVKSSRQPLATRVEVDPPRGRSGPLDGWLIARVDKESGSTRNVDDEALPSQ